METDVELLNAARAMNKDALVKIFDLYASPLYRYAVCLCGDPVLADQIVGDVFAKLIELFSSGNGPSANLRSYLYRTTHNRIIDEARSLHHKASLEAAEWLSQDVHAAFMSLEDQMLLEPILHAIRNKLTADQRHVIILRFWEGFSLRETGAIIGKREDHVKVIQSRAIAVLRKALGEARMRASVSPSSANQSAKPLGI